eukprot:Clim_evm3s27 gene=Clim_evmTU3s27
MNRQYGKNTLTKPLSPLDNAFRVFEGCEGQIMTVGSVWVFDEGLDEMTVYDAVDRWISEFPELKMKAMDRSFKHLIPRADWVIDQKFSIERHLTFEKLPTGSAAELRKRVGDLYAAPLEQDRPLWHMTVFTNYDGGAAVLNRMNHAYLDGQGGIRMLLQLCEQDPEKLKKLAGHTARAKMLAKKPTLTKRVTSTAVDTYHTKVNTGMNFLVALVYAYIAGIIALANGMVDIARDWLRYFMFVAWCQYHTWTKAFKVMTTRRTIFNLPDSPIKDWTWSEAISVADMKKIGKAIGGVSINDLMVGLLQQTMIQYAEEQNGKIPEKTFNVFTPISKRAWDDWDLGNKVSGAVVPFRTDLNDIVDIIRDVNKEMGMVKLNTVESDLGYYTSPLTMSFPPAWGRTIFGHMRHNYMHALLTNVPGPTEALVFAGKEITAMIPVVPQPAVGAIGTAVISYNGVARLCLVTDQGHIKGGSQALADQYVKNYEDLRDRVLGKEAATVGGQ